MTDDARQDAERRAREVAERLMPCAVLFGVPDDRELERLRTQIVSALLSEGRRGEARGLRRAAEVVALMDIADEALDNESHPQFLRDDDMPDDCELQITAGTVRKINRLFNEIDKLRSLASSIEGEAGDG